MSVKEASQSPKREKTSPTLLEQIASNSYYYYDNHPTKEDLMGESVAQSTLIRHLVSVLEWLYRREGWFVAANLNVYQTPGRREYPLAPDVALFKVPVGEADRHKMRSWKMLLRGHPPEVVFEICSDETWKDDLEDKPDKYGRMGVREYFAYDPYDPPIWQPRSPVGLRGWRYLNGEKQELQPDEQGRLWSAELDSWLRPDGLYLRLEAADGQPRLTEAEAHRAAKEAAWAKLRELGIDPESLT